MSRSDTVAGDSLRRQCGIRSIKRSNLHATVAPLSPGEPTMRKAFIALVLTTFAIAHVARADDEADARAILDRAIKAHGGEAALGKFVAMYYKVKGNEFDGDMKTPISFEWFFQGDDKETIISYDENDKVTDVEIVNGNEGWEKDARRVTEEMSKEKIESRQEDIYLNWATMFVPLKGKGYQLSPLGETDVAGRKAIGILVRHDKHADLKFYFDRETHLLAKHERKLKNSDDGKEHTEECLYSDFRTVQDVQQPFKVEGLSDGVKEAEFKVVEMKLYDKPLDEKLFSKP
jgi:hypothetical protein